MTTENAAAHPILGVSGTSGIPGVPGIDRRIRVLIVDDSVVIRRMIARVLEEDAGIEVVGTAANGVRALEKVDELVPDILTLDIEMPEMDGLETLSRLHQRHPEVRVIMFSTLTERGARATIDSLLRGASEYVTKPVNTGSSEEAIARLREVLLPKLKQFYTLKPKAPAVSSALLAANATQVAISPPVISTIAPTHMSAVMPAKTAVRRTRPYRILAIGVSTGGPTALGEVMPEIPADFPLPIVIVQHMPPLFTQVLAERLNGKCRIRVVEAGHNMLLEPGTAYIAPGNFHMRFETHGPQTLIALDQGPMENSCRPAVDVMLRSAAEVFQGDVLVAILTGMGRDGALGAGLVKSRGGYVIAQDHDSSVVWGMPGAVVEAGLADMVVSLKSVGQCLMRQVRQVANA